MSNEVDINPNELKINIWSAKRRGSWDMHMAKGVQLVHLPSGIVIETEEKHSQHANRALALKLLKDKLAHKEG